MNNPVNELCDRSRLPGSKRASAALRKQRERMRRRTRGYSRTEVWITRSTKTMLTEFSRKSRLRLVEVVEAVAEFATPLFLREVERRIQAILPDVLKIQNYERMGVAFSEKPTLPYRLKVRSGEFLADPHEHFLLRMKIDPILAQLKRYGIERATVWDFARGTCSKTA